MAPYKKQWDPEKLKLASRNKLKLELGGYVGPLRVEIPFFVLVGKSREPKFCVVAAVHGNEYEGVAALLDLARELDPHKLRGMLTLVPAVNPQAVYAGSRRNPIDLADLNRTFPGKPDGTLSERLAYTVFHEFVVGNKLVLSMHGWWHEAAVIPYVEYPLGSSAAARRSRDAALATGLEHLHPYHWLPGQLGAQALLHGVAALEPEVGGMGMVTPEGQRTYRNMVYRLLVHLGMLDAKDSRADPPGPAPKLIDHGAYLANYAGLFRSYVRVGESVKKGDLLWRILSLAGDCLEEFRAPRPSIVGMLRTFASVQPGDLLSQLFWESRQK
jgi:predicted deacylase